MGVKTLVKRIGNQAGNRVAQLSVLSSDQLEQVQVVRDLFLSEQPDPNDPAKVLQTERMLAACGTEIFNAYLSQIKDLYVPLSPKEEYGVAFDVEHNIRYINITKWVTDPEENSLEKLVNVYAALSDEDCNIALVFNRTKEKANVYLAVVNTHNDGSSVDVDIYKQRLVEAIRGNFPGSEWQDSDGIGIIPCLNRDRPYSVATATNIPTEKSEKFISQTIDKLLDGTIPDSKKSEYTIVLLATPVRDVEERKLRLSEYYSSLSPYASWQTDFHFTDNQAFGSSATIGVNVGASAGVQNGTNASITGTKGETESISDATTDTSGESFSEGTTHGTNSAETDFISGSVEAGLNLGKEGLFKVGGALTTGNSKTKGKSKSFSSTKTESALHSATKTVGKAANKALSTTAGVAKSISTGINFGASFARSSTVTAMLGKNEGITQSFTNYSVQHALSLLDAQMDRMESSSALGLWDFAAYILSEDQTVASNVAHTYLALTMGEESYMSKSAINLWRGNVDEERDTARAICEYIRQLRHPIFGFHPGILELDSEFYVYPPVITATSSLSGKELAYSLNFPRKSVPGLPVLECATFGRNVVTYDAAEAESKVIRLGDIYHMHHAENSDVELSLDSLKSHTFITGSTGSGKSNAIYQILQRAKEHGTSFLVVEPAKGEYKSVFGNEDDVFVYGTNPKTSPLLHMNPFSFPEDVHVLEHIDRLVEIFNVCWPMYAAMPAVLKSAVERSYKDCGWDLITSVNTLNERLFPEFSDVARNIRIIIEASEYDVESKGAYKGALLTRLEALNTGIYGMIFSSDELPDSDLFEHNVILDLSRVGSVETKSLLMGMVILKLQEYRMTQKLPVNADLRHLTVIEEAHNLLRRSSDNRTGEGADIVGKSVEMIANAIAEMRTYGEGFIIADQAPGLMDMSVIRNTNTKVILRIPDMGDRQLIGKSANLTDAQINELAKLPRGVAAVYQNEWIQPVLCKVDRFDHSDEDYTFSPEDISDQVQKVRSIKHSLISEILDKEMFQIGDKEDMRKIRSLVLQSNLSTIIKVEFLRYLDATEDEGLESLRKMLFELVNAEDVIEEAKRYGDIHEWVDALKKDFAPDFGNCTEKQTELAIALILYEKVMRDSEYKPVLSRYIEEYQIGGELL